MARVFATVGMSGWPFDRFLTAVDELTDAHEVFVQAGCSRLSLRCASVDYLSPRELEERIRNADVVLTHAGNTVRLAQRWGQVPVAVARVAARGEAANDHQVEFLRREETRSPVIAVWDLAGLAGVVNGHSGAAAELAGRPVPEPVSPEQLREAMAQLCQQLVRTRRPRRRR